VSADRTRLAGLADQLRGLHEGPVLVLPNVWDAASARVVAEAGFPAVATASAAITAMLGYPDGEGAPRHEMFAANQRVAQAVTVPVSMDAEGGYGMAPQVLVDLLLSIGVVGCNLEDTDHRRGGLREADQHASWLGAVREAADSSGVPIVINARVDAFLPASGIAEAEQVAETVRRGQLYRDAGADCVYPIGVADAADLSALISGIGGPVNANTSASLGLEDLRLLGAARVSYGPRFYRAGLAELGRAVRDLR
jgi:2-methylisocitrate lyase-like PEP mutase family enzyme